MKYLSYVKGFLSAIVLGLGQLLNKQYLKALFFFLFFALFIGIEITTSNYGKEVNPYDRISGESYDHNFFQKYYEYVKYKNSDPDLIKFYGEVTTDGMNPENFNEEVVIKYLADEIIEKSVTTFTNVANNSVINLENFNNIDTVKAMETDYPFFINNGKFYREYENVAQKTKYLNEIDIITGKVTNDYKVTNYSEGYVRYYRGKDLEKDSRGNLYLVVNNGSINGEANYLSLKDKSILESLNGKTTKIVIDDMLMIDNSDNIIYEYYEAGLPRGNDFIQYKWGPKVDAFRSAVENQYSQFSGMYKESQYNKFLLKLLFSIQPELGDDFDVRFNNFYYDKAGMFVKSFWGIITLGETSNINYNQHKALSEGFQIKVNKVTLDAFDTQLMGHVTVNILLESIIGIILVLFYLIFVSWSASDAYKVSEQKRLKKQIQSTKEYFADVYESSFEYIILSPALFVLALISIMPIVFGFIIAFTSISGSMSLIENFSWAGFNNFFNLFNFSDGLGGSFGTMFWKVLLWTVIWAVFSTATCFFGGLFQALILNSEHVVFRKFWRSILILPWAIPALLSQMVFSIIFKETGLINQIIESLGFYTLFENLGILGVDFSTITNPIQKLFYLGPENIKWFTNTDNILLARTTLIVLNIWLGFPYFMALMSGVMTSIDKTLYEAAEIDGATKSQQLRLITMPLIMYSTAPILIMTFSGNFNNFGVIYFITQGGPNNDIVARAFAGDTDILISWMYKLTVNEQIYNMASVFSVLIFIVVGSVTAWNLSRTRAFQED